MSNAAARTDALGPRSRVIKNALDRGAGLLALAVLGLEIWRPAGFPAATLGLLSLLSLAVTSAQLISSPKRLLPRLLFLLPFLPAVPLALALAFFGVVEASSLLAAVAFGLQARCFFLGVAESKRETREQWARALEAQRPSQACVFVDNDIESEVKAEALREGHTFHLAPGQIIPADGVVTYGSGFVDENLVASERESLQLKGMGSQVLGGGRNKNGALLVRATAVGPDTFSQRLANRIRVGSELEAKKVIFLDALLTLFSLALLIWIGPSAALKIFLLSAGAGTAAFLEGFELSLAEAAVAHRWLWKEAGGLRGIAGARTLVVPMEGVLSEGRLKLVAVECTHRLTDSAVIALLAPLARKIESPAAFALLQEMRMRNIPLQAGELFQATNQGGTLLVAGEEIHWIALGAPGTETPALGSLDAFVREHQSAGDTVVLMERQSMLQAALAFRDAPIPGTAEAAETMRGLGVPILLLSALPKRVVARLQTEFGVEHAQGDAGVKEAENLLAQLSRQKLAPAWVQTSPHRPAEAHAVVSGPSAGVYADLTSPHLDLPSLSLAFLFAREAARKFRLGLAWIFGAQTFLLTALILSRHQAWAPGLALTALFGILPGFVAWLFLRTRTA